MPSSNQKKIGQGPEKETITLQDTLSDTWKVMKPFVHFSIKALKVVAHALIFIVKQIPKPEDHQPKGKKIRSLKFPDAITFSTTVIENFAQLV